MTEGDEKNINSREVTMNDPLFEFDQSGRVQSILQHGSIENKFPDEDAILVSNVELDALLQDVRDIKEINIAIGEMLDTQDEHIEKIDSNIESTMNNLNKSEKELNTALKYKRDGIVNVVGTASGAVVGSVFGPIGSIIGAAVGLGSAVVINIVRK
jgi:tetrahydromethanopterin S-methyltransferase subunit B